MNLLLQPAMDLQLHFPNSAGPSANDSTDTTALASDSNRGAAAALAVLSGPKRMRRTYPYEVDSSLPADHGIRFDRPKKGNLFERIEILQLGEYLELSNHALLEGRLSGSMASGQQVLLCAGIEELENLGQ